MGLNDSYDHVMDPSPSINKVYSMMLHVEKQREVRVKIMT